MLILIAMAPAAAAAKPATRNGPIEPLSAAGRWIVDRSGRVVIFHGVNIVPPGPGGTPARFGIGRNDLRFLARQGFRLVRFGAFYADVEPGPDSYDKSFMRGLGRYAKRIARQRMFVLFDFHQDLYASSLKGRGFPEWMVLTDGQPVEPNPGFAGGYFTSPAANRAYDNFWADRAAVDGVGIQTHFARGWSRIAARLSRLRRVLGYDLLNEPWPGSQWPSCANPAGCPPGGFDQTLLTDFSRRMADAIRVGDRRRIVFAEPNLMFDVGANSGLGGIGDSNAGLSFHDYCLGAAPGLPGVPDPFQLCTVGEQLVFDNAEAYSDRTGAALLLTEFSDTKDPSIATRMTDLLDRNMLPWTFWSYWAANGQILKDPAKPPDPANLEQPLLDAVVRPYPYVVAGTPLGFGYERDSRTFRLSYSTRSTRTGRRVRRRISEIVVPRRVYPWGRYRTEVEGGRRISRRGAATLRIGSGRRAAVVSVTVKPRGRAGPRA